MVLIESEVEASSHVTEVGFARTHRHDPACRIRDSGGSGILGLGFGRVRSTRLLSLAGRV